MKHHIVEPRIFQQCESLVEGVQKFQTVVLRVEHCTRVRMEAEEGGFRVVSVCNLPQLLIQPCARRACHRTFPLSGLGPFGTFDWLGNSDAW